MIPPFNNDQANHELIAPLRHEPLVVNVHEAGATRVAHHPAPLGGWRYREITHIVDRLAVAPCIAVDASLDRARIGTTH